uniref:Glycerophosphocholine acyltransferase 1 n=2 Tax=Pseudo-nitzschia australis TaxID=44445 RepID=A0A7S4AAJ5_9STRA|mmetsp:Transcript_10187/g.20083  ORF Transcript_10187/g.20083 Transcript_10187/m.20083 type:complete len:542 (+) Transcript_10187:173-1798(+)
MKEDQYTPQNNPGSTNKEEPSSPLLPPSVASSTRSARRSSFSASLRLLRDDIAAVDSSNENNANANDDGDDDFVFTDQIHKYKELEQLNATLTEIGLMDSVDDDNEDNNDDGKEDAKRKESAPLVTASSSIKTIPGTRSYRRQSKIDAYNHGQKESFLAVLDRVDQIQDTTRNDKGLNEWNFTFGLVNCLFIAYVHGSYPEHFWILYAIETIFWMSYKLKGMYHAKPLCEVLYYFDFCWVMNTLCAALIVTGIVSDGFSTDYISVELRKKLFLACFGIFCGPIFMAAMVLPFVAFLFHDVNTMANLIIHLMPSMVMYNYRWHAADISAAYPAIYPHLPEFTADFNNDTDTGRISRITIMVYFAWFVPYTLWMLLVGLKLPVVPKADEKKPPPKYDTVFHSTWNGALCEVAGTMVWKRSKKRSRDCSERNDYEVRDFMLYMVGHAVGSCGIGIIILGDILCYRGGRMVHGTMLWLATIICAKRGADRYAYYVTKMYGQKLRKAFREEMEQEQKLQELSHGVDNNGAKYGSIEEENEGSTIED